MRRALNQPRLRGFSGPFLNNSIHDPGAFIAANSGLNGVISELVAGACVYSFPAVSCVATGTYEAIAYNSEGALTYAWSIIAGTANIISPAAKITDITTEAGSEQSFTVQCEITDDNGSFIAARIFNHAHVESLLIALGMEDGNNWVAESGDNLITE
jgi:hypothetical protein